VFGVAYGPHRVTGTGTIDAYPVKCITAYVMIEFHSGYELNENDYHDIQALCGKFGFELTEEYQKFVEEE